MGTGNRLGPYFVAIDSLMSQYLVKGTFGNKRINSTGWHGFSWPYQSSATAFFRFGSDTVYFTDTYGALSDYDVTSNGIVQAGTGYVLDDVPDKSLHYDYINEDLYWLAYKAVPEDPMSLIKLDLATEAITEQGVFAVEPTAPGFYTPSSIFLCDADTSSITYLKFDNAAKGNARRKIKVAKSDGSIISDTTGAIPNVLGIGAGNTISYISKDESIVLLEGTDTDFGTGNNDITRIYRNDITTLVQIPGWHTLDTDFNVSVMYEADEVICPYGNWTRDSFDNFLNAIADEMHI